jgi:radical SAM superfamily enzyme YgiQ (UPF0313 family)
MPMSHWEPILDRCRKLFPRLRRVSCYATASNVIDKGEANLALLRSWGLQLLYMGPESGDEPTMRRIAKGPRPVGAPRDTSYLYDAHVQASRLRREAGLALSAIFLLGAGGVARSEAHARGSAQLATDMDPEFLSALTLTVVPNTPLARTQGHSGWQLPSVEGLLTELRTFIALARPRAAVFRTNHASNYLPLGGTLPHDGPRMVAAIDRALAGGMALRPEWARGL